LELKTGGAKVSAAVLAGASVADVGDNEVVVFLIGARVHRWHKVRSWFPTFIAMPRMLIQLAKKLDLPAAQLWLANNGQYGARSDAAAAQGNDDPARRPAPSFPAAASSHGRCSAPGESACRRE